MGISQPLLKREWRGRVCSVAVRNMVFSFLSFLMLHAAQAQKPQALLEHPPEPTYQGRTVRDWVASMSPRDHDARARSLAALKQMGPAALPSLLRELLPPLTAEETAAAKAYAQLPPLMRGGQNPAPKCFSNERLLASLAFRELGTNALPVLPILIETVANDPYFGVRVNLIPVLVNLAPNTDHAAASVEALIKTTADPHPHTAKIAYWALRHFPDHAERIVPVLIEGLNDWRIVNTCVESLQHFGAAAVPYLLRAQADEYGYVRPAELALEKIDPKAAEKARAEKSLAKSSD